MRPATTSAHHKRLVRRALQEIYADGNLQVANELIHPDFVDHEPAHPEQLRFEVQDEIAEDSLMGREPTGKGFAVRHTYIWRIAGDKIAEHWGSRDDLGLLGQLGFLQLHEEPEAP